MTEEERQRIVQAAVDEYAYDDVEISGKVTEVESGYWVEAWVWVPKEEVA